MKENKTGLNDVEMKVLRLRRKELTCFGIAKKLGIPESTVYEICSSKWKEPCKRQLEKAPIAVLGILFMFLFLSSFASAVPVLLSDQGTDVKESGSRLSSGNLTVLIYSASSGGPPIFNQTSPGAIINGSWNLMINPDLEFGKSYWKDYSINGVNLAFDGNDRLELTSPIGLINNVSFINFSLIRACSSGQAIKQINANGSVVCESVSSNGSIVDTRWNIVGSNYLINVSGVLNVNETKLNASIDARIPAVGYHSSAAGWANDSIQTNTSLNVNLLNGKNVTTTGTGFFGWLGSLTSRITKLFVQDIDFNGAISSSNGAINISNNGNIASSGNITAGRFIGDGSLLTGISGGADGTGGWTNTSTETNTSLNVNVIGITTTNSGLNSGSALVSTVVEGGTNYTILQYKTSGNSTFTAPTGVTTVRVLVVGGGGGGSTQHGGGGGAGGLIHNASYSVTAGTPLNITVGSGGAGGPSQSTAGVTGSNSVFGAITAGGGGGAGAGYNFAGAGNGLNGSAVNGNGGGAGGSGTNGTGGFGNGAGFNGGRSVSAGTAGHGGGGGGSSQAGGNATGTGASNNGAGGYGGNGTVNNINGTNVTYAGGGGGGKWGSGSGSLGGTGGGGNSGSVGVNGVAGVANTGGGGGGAGEGNTFGAAGGSGIVIVRFETQTVTANAGSRVGIGTATPASKLHVSDTTTNVSVFRIQDSSGYCDYNPESSAPTVSCTSDEELKDNIVEASSTLGELEQYDIKEYNVKASGEETVGVIAQEVAANENLSDTVHEGEDGLLMVELPNPWKIVKAIQELGERLKKVEAALGLVDINDTKVSVLNVTNAMINPVANDSDQKLDDIIFIPVPENEAIDNDNETMGNNDNVTIDEGRTAEDGNESNDALEEKNNETAGIEESSEEQNVPEETTLLENVAIVDPSDLRLKKDIKDTTSSLAEIMGFRVVDFTFVSTGEDRTGVIAQEVQETSPELVHKGSDGYFRVEQISSWKLVKALQELFNWNEKQDEAINELRSENEMLKQELCVKESSYSWCNKR